MRSVQQGKAFPVSSHYEFYVYSRNIFCQLREGDFSKVIVFNNAFSYGFNLSGLTIPVMIPDPIRE